LLTIINDGSTDSTEATVRQLLSEVKTDTLDDDEAFTVGLIGSVPTIMISHLKHEGTALSKNKGILSLWQHMKYFTVLEPTSTFMPSKLIECLLAVESDPNIGVVYHDCMMKVDGITYRQFYPAYDRESLVANHVIPSGGLIPKKALEAVGGFEHTLQAYEDWDLWLRITERFIAVHIPEVLSIDALPPAEINTQALKVVMERTQARQIK